ncbi:MAG: hypothetical protein CMH24_03455 [Nitrosomonadales bacterium]|nr:hypothetical protein [Nitrosomonadales bacterium]
MIDIYLITLTNLIIFATFGWILSLKTNNVTHVDSMWSIFFIIAIITSVSSIEALSYRHEALILIVFLWATRLSAFLTKRNWGKKEDIRYQNIRKNNQPHFKYKSLYLIFYFQAILASIIALPLIASISDPRAYSFIDKVALAIIIFGLLIEIIADFQLSKFLKKDTFGVMDKGLWRYSRHPNYFGEFVVWWGFFIFSFGSGSWVTIFSPILMTILLLKISGVGLMEQTISKRRPDYEKYIKKTSSFILWPPKN